MLSYEFYEILKNSFFHTSAGRFCTLLRVACLSYWSQLLDLYNKEHSTINKSPYSVQIHENTDQKKPGFSRREYKACNFIIKRLQNRHSIVSTCYNINKQINIYDHRLCSFSVKHFASMRDSK